jgi:hypothetical protein
MAALVASVMSISELNSYLTQGRRDAGHEGWLLFSDLCASASPRESIWFRPRAGLSVFVFISG